MPLTMFLKILSSVRSYRNFFILILCVVLFPVLYFSLIYLFTLKSTSGLKYLPLTLNNINSLPSRTIDKHLAEGGGRINNCSHFDCFNIYKCGHLGQNKIQIYVYPLANYFDHLGSPLLTQISQEFYDILKTIIESPYYTPNPEEACIFVPSIDTLNQNRFRPVDVSRILNSLTYWNSGENHLMWNFLPGSAPDFNTVVDLALGKAMVAGAGFSSWAYRVGFDVSLPVYSPLIKEIVPCGNSCERDWLSVNAQLNLHKDYVRELNSIPELIILTSCHKNSNQERCYQGETYKYPQILQRAIFCIVVRGARLGQQALIEALSAGCIPVIAAQSLVLPFQDVLDWKRAAIIVPERDLSSVMIRLSSISNERRNDLRLQGEWLYKTYFESIEKITKATLDIINNRVYPQHAPNYDHWNLPPYMSGFKNPLLLQLTAPRVHGFTAVVLTYDRVDSLFILVGQLSRVPSLTKIIVVWNNQNKDPPSATMWPQVSTPIEVIRTKENKLSNRFYPYDQIETEAVLSIDDDIVMLTPDELEFGFEVWREFPDRIVGFPSRTHVWDNLTQSWKYESEWRNDISMVLTGAAFHHKYWNYMYTMVMPNEVKQWVDDRMNCEDIAMNFLVANVTRKAPIKVTPRKKFKCPKCTNTEMLSADLTHMRERSACINKFVEIYGCMPLINVEFRADPVLFKDTFPEKLKRFNDIGALR